MFKIINDNELLSFSDIREKYDGYLVLVKKAERMKGLIYGKECIVKMEGIWIR